MLTHEQRRELKANAIEVWLEDGLLHCLRCNATWLIRFAFGGLYCPHCNGEGGD